MKEAYRPFENFGFYSERKGEPLEGLELRDAAVWFMPLF